MSDTKHYIIVRDKVQLMDLFRHITESTMIAYDIEKKSLEAHVELCAERYKLLELKLETLESNVDSLKTTIDEVHNIVQDMAAKRNDQLVTWGSGIIGMLLATVGWLVTTYVFK